MKILDNYLDDEEFKVISKNIMSINFPLYYEPQVNDNDKSNFYFMHNLYLRGVQSNFFYLIQNILKKLDVKALIRAKVNCFPKTENMIKYGYHKDYDFKHKGAILYLNTCNGGTYLKNDFVQSIENRVLLFDSTKNHASTNCTDQNCRYNININYF